MQQWEYCAIVGILRNGRRFSTLYPGVVNFTPNGMQGVDIKGNEREETAKAIAQLGEQGWEMVGCVPDSGATTIFFKRPKQAQR